MIDLLWLIYFAALGYVNKVSTQIDSQQASSVGIHPAAFELASWQKSVLSPREAWIESLKAENSEEKRIQLLNPTVFAHYPRIDLLFKNVRWQKLYKHVSYANAPVRHEISRSLKKPWPQKGMGKARHGDRRSPIWIGGAKAHGPRGPKTYYHELSFMVRLKGLSTALSMKLAQDDLHIVENLDIDVDDPKAFEEVLDSRLWGPSVLFVDDTDFMPERISLVTDKIPHYNLMPVYGLNVYSMLKHTTLVLTVDAVKRIEERMLYHLNRTNMPNV